VLKILQKITSQNNFNLIEALPLSGGDINKVFLLKCEEGSFVIKLNDASKFPGMFEAEAKGLILLGKSSPFRIPNVMATGNLHNSSFLIMEHISPKTPKTDFWKIFSYYLSELHKTTSDNFGLDHNNYIGSLPQQNRYCTDASSFYISQRLEPQFKMASERGFHFKNLDDFYGNIKNEIPHEVPALIHGDLWSGNFMVSEEAMPVLIDPAVSFAPREMDLAMMKLFGGFDAEIFNLYNEYFPLSEGWENRVDIWQLYYLLVHLNLFGGGYFSQVKTIISKYT